MIDRRRFLTASAALLGLAGTAQAEERLEARFAAIEAACGGRLGVAVRIGRGPVAGYRLNEFFPMCSTSKLLMTGAILARVDLGQERLERSIAIRPEDRVEYAPIGEKHVNGSLTLEELCEAAMTVSDNIAANLILKTLGGPQTVTAFARSIGDGRTRLDRMEPDLNSVPHGDTRDSTTPAAMLKTLRTLALGDSLSPASRQRMRNWLIACRTGDERLRAGIPKDWIIGDKTGTWTGNGAATSNDVAVAWRPDGQTVAITAYLTDCPAPAAVRNAALANVARAATSGL
ncbi:MAG TPA: class A beta-lactamase [Candidatus Sulfotelmatobacter sp.]|nr:class A beta-lactamase [Candidatus Sulfotelmatobacter sp.]